MKTKNELELRIKECEKALQEANCELQEFIDSPENNVYPTLEEALDKIEDRLLGEARAACEGSYNLGADEYEQEFIVDGEHYMATLTVEYNRHDKTYYYVDGSEFSHRKL